MSPNKEIVYTRDPSLPGIKELRTASIANFLFSGPYVLDDHPAFIDPVSGTTLSRAEVYDLSLKLGASVNKKGLKRGKGVGMIFSPNTIIWPVVFLGLLAGGVRTTLANSSYTPSELAHQVRDSGANLIFVHPSLFSVAIDTMKVLKIDKNEMKKRIVIMSYLDSEKKDERDAGIGNEWMRLHEFFQNAKLKKEVVLHGKDTDETAVLCYSSGTTGLSKGVESTHRNIVTIFQIYQPDAPKAIFGKDVELGVLPFYHIFGIIKVLCFSFWTGTPVVVLSRFEPIAFCATIQKYKVSLIKLVPPVLVVLASHPCFDQYDLSTLKFIMSGAAPLGEGLVKRVLARFEKKGWKGLTITQGYGLTETSPTATYLPEKDTLRKAGSIGVLMPTLEARLVDDDENDIEPGPEKSGELWLRGPSIMKGYLNNPTATKNALVYSKSSKAFPWFKTGDIAVRDNDGFLFIVDRKKELIKYKGFQVPPADLEAILLTKEDVADVGVIGVESKAQATELPRAYIVSTRNAELLKDPKAKAAYELEVEQWIRTKVAKHKFLRGGVKVIDVIPKSGAGKILRRQLRDMANKEIMVAEKETAKL